MMFAGVWAANNPAAGKAAAMMLWFQIVRQWRRAADLGRWAV
jgi:hypothetical protein